MDPFQTEVLGASTCFTIFYFAQGATSQIATPSVWAFQ